MQPEPEEEKEVWEPWDDHDWWHALDAIAAGLLDEQRPVDFDDEDHRP